MRSIFQIALQKLYLPRNAEYAIQHSIVEFLKYNKIFCFAVPNGTNISNAITRAILHLVGLTGGVSDLVLVLQKRVVFVEIKTKTGKQQINQKDFQKIVESLGFKYYIWRSVDDAKKFIGGIK